MDGLFHLILVIILSGSSVTYRETASLPSQINQNAGFRPAECMFDLPIGATDSGAVECGYLTVPADHANPSGPSIELAVAIFKSPSSDRQPDPLFIAQGGPGGSTIDTYAQILLNSDNGLLTNREIVLFDQRGTLYSKPTLYCTEIDRYTIDTLDENLTHEESEQRYQQALAACRQRLISEGIDLSAFNSLENAADIEDLRLALGYDKINLYGVSYGTLLALHYMRMYPQSLRSVVLDGVLPPQTNFILNVGQTQNQAFTRLFEACRNDVDCSRYYPNLEETFVRVVDQLEDQPAHVTMTDINTGDTYSDVVINGETFLSGVFQMMYSSDLVQALPRMIFEADRGNFDAFSRILAIFVFDRSMSYGMYYSVLCAEDADYSSDDHDLSGVRPEIARYEETSPEEFLAACKMWNVEPFGPEVDRPVESDVPTLLLSGGFDPITPDAYAAETADTLSASHNYVIPTGSHGQAFEGECQNQLILSFLENPIVDPDTTCLQDLQKPSFYTPQNVADLPLVIDILNLKPLPTTALLLIVLAVLFLWTGAVIFPTSWLIERTRSRPQSESAFYTEENEALVVPTASTTAKSHFPERFSSWLTILAAVILSIVVLALFVFSIKMVVENDNRLFFGLPGETRPLWILPWVFLAITLLLIWSAFQIWMRRNSPLWRRIYLTMLAFTATTAILLMAYLGFLSAVF